MTRSIFLAVLLPALAATGLPHERTPEALTFGSRTLVSDLAITKTASPNPVPAGTNVTYTIRVINNGPLAALSVTVTDTLPAGTTFVSCAATDEGVCEGSGNNRTVSFTSLAAADTAVVTLIAKVGATLPDGTLVRNTARVASAAPPDPDTTNNSATSTVTTSNPQADLALTKAASPNPVRSGTNLTYTLQVSNDGAGATSVVVTDTLPAVTSFVSCVAGFGGVCGGTGRNRTVSFASLASGASATVTLVAQVAAGTANGTVISNTARVRAASPADPNNANNTASVSVTATNPTADLALTKSAAPDPVQAGSNVTYTLGLSNAGPAAATSVVVTDTLPSATSFVSCVATGGGVCGGSGNNRTVSFASLASGASATVTLVAQVSSTVADQTEIRNTARVRAADPPDPNGVNNTATVSVTASNPSADLSLTKSAAPNPVQANTNVTYTVRVTNGGPSNAGSVVVTDTLPAGTTFVSCSTTGGGVCGGSGNNRTVSFASLASGASPTVTLVTKVAAGTANGTVIRNTARVRAAGPVDPNSANNSATASVTVSNPSADLALTKTGSPNPVQANANVTYTVRVTNGGPSNAGSVVVTDTLPAGTSFVSCGSTGGGACGGSGNNRTVSFASLASGVSATVTLVAKVAAGTANGTVIRNTARVRAAGPVDPNSANNSAVASVTVSNPSADLALTKGASPDPVQANANVTYTVRVTNGGPSSASSVVVTDTLPAVTSFVSCASTGGGTCAGSGRNRTVSFGSLASGTSATVTLVAKVAAGTANGTVIRNTARVQASSPADPSSANNSATVSVTVSNPSADLGVTKSASPDPVLAGQNITYTVQLTNGGPSAASSVVVTDTLPAVTSFVSCASTGGGTCGGSGRNRTVSFGSLASGASATVTLVAKVTAGTANGTVIRNTARVKAASPGDASTGNNSATVAVIVSNPSADLALTKGASPDPVQANANVTYTVRLTNGGPSGASSVVVTDTLPVGTTYVSCSSTGGGTCAGSGRNRTVSFGSLVSGASATVTLVAKVAAGTANGTVIRNTARVKATSPADPSSTNNSATVSVTVSNPSADLGVTKGASPNPVQANANITYTVQLTNGGPSAASSVVVTDTLPVGTSFVSCSSTGGGVCGGSGRNRTVSFGSLASGASATVTLVAKVAAGTANGTVISNRARVKASSPADPSSTNNSATVSVTVSNPSADLALTKSASPDPVQAGSNVTYTLGVTNGGPSTASSVVVTDTLPVGTSYVSCSSTGGGTCGGSGRNRTISFGSLASDASATVTLVAKVAAGTASGTVIRNTGRVKASGPSDASTGNNSATASVTVSNPAADLALTKSAAPNPVQAGANVTYTIRLSNGGPSAASSVVVTDTLPVGTSYVSCTSTGGGTCGGSGRNRTVSFGSLASGVSSTVTLVAKVAAGTADGAVIRNTARARAAGPADPSTGNNSATASATVSNASADLALTKTASPDPVQANANVTYTLRVTNSGPSPANSVVVTDTLPVGTSFVSCSSTGGGACAGSGRNRKVSFSSLASGASATVTLVAKVAAGTASGTVIRNTGRVKASGPSDASAGNNSATASVTVSGAGADLALVKTASPDPVQPGSNVTYTLRLSSGGPSAASSVVVTDTLPASTTFVSCTSNGSGVCAGSGRNRTISFSSFASGASATITLVAKVSSTVADRTVIRNVARVRASSPSDPAQSNNSSTALVTAVKPSGSTDLAVTKSASPNPVKTGTNLIYTVNVRNNGPGTATSVTMTDTLPEETSFVSCSSTASGVCAGEGRIRTVSFSSLGVGASASVTLVAKVRPEIANGKVIRNTARVRAPGNADPTASNNAATVAVTASTSDPTAPQVYHVATTGLDTNPGTAAQPLRTVQRAVDRTQGGDVILVHSGTYDGVIRIGHSGDPGLPITIRAVGDGPAVLKATHPARSCTNAQPIVERTIRITEGSDHWTIEGLQIVGGIFVFATNVDELANHVKDRSLPGRGMSNRQAARGTIESLGGDPADSIQILNNRIRGRGVYAAGAREGRFEGNEVYDIACGTGSAFSLNKFSDGWSVKNNHIHDMAASADHWMTEGIRLVGASMYNTIENNLIERANGPGRGITSDLNSGWNVFRKNEVIDTEQAYSEQFGGWGNLWTDNISRNSRKFGFRFAEIDPNLTVPNDRVPRYVTMRCNRSITDQQALNIGWAIDSDFEKNDFPTVALGTNMRNYWSRSGNTWEGGTALPPSRPPPPDQTGCAL